MRILEREHLGFIIIASLVDHGCGNADLDSIALAVTNERWSFRQREVVQLTSEREGSQGVQLGLQKSYGGALSCGVQSWGRGANRNARLGPSGPSTATNPSLNAQPRAL